GAVAAGGAAESRPQFPEVNPDISRDERDGSLADLIKSLRSPPWKAEPEMIGLPAMLILAADPAHSVIFTKPSLTSCGVLAMASVLTLMLGSRSAFPQW